MEDLVRIILEVTLIIENIFCVSLTRNRREMHVSLGEGSGKNLDMFLLKKCNFFLISEFKYGQAWKKWPSPLSLLLYSTFKNVFKTVSKTYAGFFFFLQK